MKTDLEKWLASEGKIFLKEIGVEKGQVISDFGCGVGHYTIPVAKVVGKEGKVYAVDKDSEALNQLMQAAKSEGLKNIEPINTQEELKIELKDESVDVILLYDVIHLVNDRKKLYEEALRVARENALISVLPKHFREYMHMSLEDVRNEIKKTFYFEGMLFRKINHDDKLQRGHIFNFRKRLKSASSPI